MSRLELPPRLTDATVLVVTALALATGLWSLVSGVPGDAWLFVGHGVAGLALVVLLVWKFRRVAPRVTARRWTGATVVSVLTATVAVAALATGVAWVLGLSLPGRVTTLLTVHAVLGVLVVPLLVVHLAHRFRLPRAADFAGRRTVLQYAGLAAVGSLAWLAQDVFNRLVSTAGADRRFTGSRPAGGPAGNAYPVTMWVADDPAPVDAGEWSLAVRGAVERPVALDYDAVADHGDAVVATLDCTGGWYADREWEGVRVGRLLDLSRAADDARWVRFRSVTGYRWSLPVAEARSALLATRVGGERLSHGHGFPLRLVAPGRRGFQWVKWVTAVEVRTRPDPGQWAAIFLSGFTSDGE